MGVESRLRRIEATAAMGCPMCGGAARLVVVNEGEPEPVPSTCPHCHAEISFFVVRDHQPIGA